MAKSLRSKAKQQNKVEKRNSVFGSVAAAREQRIAERLHNAAIGDIMSKQEAPGDDGTMEIEAEKPSVPKVKKVKKVDKKYKKNDNKLTGRQKSKLDKWK